jgi:hypothetical protein
MKLERVGANQDPYLLHLANRLTSLIEDPMQRFDNPTEQAHYDAGVRAVAKVMKPSCRRARAPPSGVHARGHRPALVAHRPDRPACHVDNARTEGFNRTIKQTKRVGCGYRNLDHHQRRILSHIAVTRPQKSAA